MVPGIKPGWELVQGPNIPRHPSSPNMALHYALNRLACYYPSCLLSSMVPGTLPKSTRKRICGYTRARLPSELCVAPRTRGKRDNISSINANDADKMHSDITNPCLVAWLSCDLTNGSRHPTHVSLGFCQSADSHWTTDKLLLARKPVYRTATTHMRPPHTLLFSRNPKASTLNLNMRRPPDNNLLALDRPGPHNLPALHAGRAVTVGFHRTTVQQGAGNRHLPWCTASCTS